MRMGVERVPLQEIPDLNGSGPIFQPIFTPSEEEILRQQTLQEQMAESQRLRSLLALQSTKNQEAGGVGWLIAGLAVSWGLALLFLSGK